MADLKWERLKIPSSGAMPGVSFHCTALRSPSSLVLFGGQRRGLSNGLYQFNPGEDGWSEHPAEGAWPAERTQATMTGIGSMAGEGRVLYLFGGSALNVGAVNDLWALTIAPEAGRAEYSWMRVEVAGALPPPRYGHSAIEWGAKLVVFGGQDDAQQFNDVWCLDTATMAWSQLPAKGTPPAPRTRCTATLVSDDAMLVLGGFSREARYLSDAHLLNLSTGAWSALMLSGAALGPRAQHAAASPDGKHVFVFGGYSGAKNLNDLLMLSLPEGVVSQLHCAAPPEPRARHSAHFLDETHLHIFGGFDGGKPWAGDVFMIDCRDPKGMVARGQEAAAGGKKSAKPDEQEDGGEHGHGGGEE